METRQEITQLIEVLPEEALGDVLTYLRQLAQATPAEMQLALHLQAILLEDHEVLARLAK